MGSDVSRTLVARVRAIFGFPLTVTRVSKWKSTFVCSWLAQICSIIGFAFVVPFLPFYVRELGITDERSVLLWAGWGLSTSAGLTMALFAPMWGTLADRYGRKLMVLRSMLGGSLVLGLMGLVTNIYQLLALRILQGMLTGTVSASVALVSSVVPTRHCGYALGLMQTALYVGNSLGPYMGGLAAHSLGYRVPFFIAASFLLAGGLLTLVGVKEEFEPPDEEAQNGEASTLGQVLALTGFAALIGLLFMVHFSGSFVNPILPLYIERLSGLPRGEASEITGRIFGLAGLAAAVAAATLGRLGDRLGHLRILTGCTLVAGLSLIPIAFVSNTNQLLFWRLVASFSGAAIIPSTNALIRRMIPRHACGKAFGLVQSVTCLGWGLGPAMGSTLAAKYGLQAPFVVVGIMFMLASGIALLLTRRLPGTVTATAPSPLAVGETTRECPVTRLAGPPPQ